jgi:predicted RNase H-like nuclease (RuvC/YqgF family)
MMYFLDYWQIIAGAIAGLGGFFMGRKMKRSQEKQTEATAMSSMQTVYDIFSEQTKRQIEILINQLNSMKEELVTNKEDIRMLQIDNRNLHLEVLNLSKENSKLKERINELEKENDRKVKENLELIEKLNKKIPNGKSK